MKKNYIFSSAISAIFMSVSGVAGAAGFALIELNASGMGNAFAGAAAVAEDASTIYFNPAGMSYLPDSQLVLASHAIRPSAKFNNQNTRGVLGNTINGSNGGDIGDLIFIPNFYFSKAINDRVNLGIGINAPFGLKTEYDNGWNGRYHAIKSEMKTININPSVSIKLNDSISLGAGINYQRVEAELTKAMDLGSICVATLTRAPVGLSASAAATTCTNAGIVPTASDGSSSFKGDDWSWGFNLGAIIKVTQTTRIGLAYRSEIKHDLRGSANIRGEEIFSNLPAAFNPVSSLLINNFQNSDVRASVDLPATFSASLHHQYNNQIELLADVTWVGWDSFDVLRVVRSSGTLSGQTLDVQPEYWHNSMRYSLGANYRYNNDLKLRVGVAYDESPAPNQWLTPRIPDSNRIWLAFGANYKITPSDIIDFGYTHIFVKNRSINTSAQAAEIAALGGSSVAGTLAGNYKSNVNIISVQYTHNF